MKMTKFVPLMFLLQVAVIPRNISANPIASPGGYGATRGTILTEQYMKKGTDILTKVMAWLKENRLSSSQFDKSVKELENQIAKLPEALAKHRPKMLEGLYKSQDRLVQLTQRLTSVATKLKEDCKTIIGLYDTNHMEKALLLYAAEVFTKRAVLVEGILKEAVTTSTEIQNQLYSTKGYLVYFNAILNLKTNNIELEQRGALAAKQDITAQVEQSPNTIILIFGSFTIIIDIGKVGEIDQNKLDTYIENLKKQLEVIKASQKAATTLLGHVNNIKEYLVAEIPLIGDWKINLQSSTSDHQDFSESNLQIGIAAIKGNLRDLIEACDNYLNHEIPDILCTRNC